MTIQQLDEMLRSNSRRTKRISKIDRLFNLGLLKIIGRFDVEIYQTN